MSKRIDTNRSINVWLARTVCLLGALFYCYEYLLRIEPGVMGVNIEQLFHINAFDLGLLSAFYYFAYTPMQLFVGLLIDRYGVRLVLTLAVFACSIGSAIFSLADILWVAKLGRFVIGFGSAFAFVGSLKLAATWLPRRQFAFFAGLTTALGMLGAMIGNVELSSLTTQVGWRNTLWIVTIVGFILVPTMFIFMSNKSKVNVVDEGVLTFVDLFRSLKQLIVNLDMWLIGIASCCLFVSLSVFAEMWSNQFIQVVYHFSIKQSVYLTGLVYLGWLIGAPFIGAISDYFNLRTLPIILGSIVAVVCSSLLLLVTDLSIIEVAVLLFLMGVGCSSQIICFVIAKEYHNITIMGTVLAFINLLTMMGGVILQPLAARLLTLFWNGTVHRGAHIYSAMTYRLAFIILPVSFMVALISIVYLDKRIRLKNESTA